MVMLAAAILAAIETGPSIAADPGFENGPGAWQLPRGYDIGKGEAKSGQAALHCIRTDPASYRLAQQSIPFEPGRRYRFAVWVKTEGVKGGDSGATICMEWSGPKGYLGGCYPRGVKGDTGWTHITGITGPVPPQATRVNVTLYLRKAMTGEAWFDDVSVSEYWGRPLEAWLLDPAYRGLIFADEPPRPIRVKVELPGSILGHTWEDGKGYAGLAAPAAVCSVISAGRTVAEKRVEPIRRRSFPVELDAAGLKPGDYYVSVRLLSGAREIGRQDLPGRKLPQGKRPSVYIGRHRHVIAGGKPFFPLGLYLGSFDEADCERISKAGFNCVMPYSFSSMPHAKAEEKLGLAQKHGIRVIYSIKDLYAGTRWFPKRGVDGITDADAMAEAAVSRFRSHPNVLAWYLNDELPPPMRGTLESRAALARRLDPDHPTWAVLYQVDQLAEYRHTCDVLGTDPYPIPSKPITMATDWAAKTRDATGGTAAFWQVPQIFNWGAYRKPDGKTKNRPPTYEEMRCMTYQALINGATGLVYYSYADVKRDKQSFEKRWADVTRVAREVRRLMPALLSEDEPPQGLAVAGAPCKAFRSGNTVWVLITNPGGKPVQARITLPANVNSAAGPDGTPLRMDGAAGIVDLPPLGCGTVLVTTQ